MRAARLFQIGKRLLRAIFLVLAISGTLLLLLYLIFVEDIEYVRLPSPDGVSQVVINRINAGATTSYGFKVYVVPLGSGTGGGTYIGSCECGVEPVWQDSSTLNLRVRNPRKFHLRNPVVEVRRNGKVEQIAVSVTSD